jgi:hypothetical protein
VDKTSLVLKTCSLKDKRAYISKAEPESSLREKIKVVVSEYGKLPRPNQ